MSDKAHFITAIEDVLITPYPNSQKEWIVRTPIVYYSAVLDRTITVGRNFITDLGSIPRLLWWLYPPAGKYTLAVILHDWEYWTQTSKQIDADMMLREAIVVCGDSKGVANNFYAGVRMGGWKAWADNAKQNKESGFVKEVPNSDIVVPRILLTHTI